jgi:DNA ligase-1
MFRFSSATKEVSIKESPASGGKKKNPFAGFFVSKTTPGGNVPKQEPSDRPAFDVVVKRSNYDPVKDAIWQRGEKVPYLAFVKTLQAIEVTSSRLKIVEILANYFRSVIALTPDELLPSVYLCLNKLAPAYEGVELGIGDMILIKAIGISTGRTHSQIKADIAKAGDLGIVAEESRGSQHTMFTPKPLLLTGVFSKLREIADLSGEELILLSNIGPVILTHIYIYFRPFQHKSQGK